MTSLGPAVFLLAIAALSAGASPRNGEGNAGSGPARRWAASQEDQASQIAKAEAATEEFLADQEKQDDQASRRRGRIVRTPTVWELYEKGGVLMYPITLLSIVVVCFGLERFIGLRRGNVVPRKLVAGLQGMGRQAEPLDVFAVLRLCQQYPSTLSRVVQDVLFNGGGPGAEVEQTMADAGQREASRLYFHVRWLNLSMSVAPMLGLLGTVQGMIIVFMGASQLAPGVSKTEYMAEGIYLKLVCTFAGLVVAIPAAVLSYLFEARIQKLMNDVDGIVRDVVRKWRSSLEGRGSAVPAAERHEAREPRVRRS